jgi:hypothetical protein
MITPDDINNRRSNVTIICKRCNNNWQASVISHIAKKVGCAHCRSRTGERLCSEYLNNIGITYQAQFRTQSTGRHSYDFMFRYKDHDVLLEFDGKQHFEFVEFFHKTNEKFLQGQNSDIFKTNQALKDGFKVIRIDYTQQDNISHHINQGLLTPNLLYFSTPEMYKYISDNLLQ